MPRTRAARSGVAGTSHASERAKAVEERAGAADALREHEAADREGDDREEAERWATTRRTPTANDVHEAGALPASRRRRLPTRAAGEPAQHCPARHAAEHR